MGFDKWVKILKERSSERVICEKCMSIDYRLRARQISAETACNELEESINKIILSGNSRIEPKKANALAEKEQIDDPFWPPFIYPASISQINSPPGLGKTTLLQNLVAKLSKGEPFMDIYPPRNLKVLYADVETPEWKIRNKLESIEDSEPLPENLDFIFDLNLREDFNELLKLTRKKKYDIVVLDTQSRILGQKEENDNSEANFLMSLLRKITAECKTAIILVHHTSKSEYGSGVYRGRGASAIAAAVDIVANLDAPEKDILKFEITKNRIEGDYPTLFLKKIGDDRFEKYNAPDTGTSGFEKYKCQDNIISLGTQKETWQTSEIYQNCKKENYSEDTIKRALSSLVQTGKISRLKRGLYKISV